jgi:NCS1 family nucleobase:cation symporter-1
MSEHVVVPLCRTPFHLISGILIADHWLVRRTRLDLAELYRPQGRYWYTGGWNWRALVAFVIGGVLAIGGSYSTVDAHGVSQGPFPANGMIPALKVLADYGWAVGLASALLLYQLLSLPAAWARD